MKFGCKNEGGKKIYGCVENLRIPDADVLLWWCGVMEEVIESTQSLINKYFGDLVAG